MKKKSLKIILLLLVSFVFIDIVGAESFNNYKSTVTSCGDGLIDKIPVMVPTVISVLYTIIQIAVPIVLVIMGSIDLIKSMTAGKDEEIKKSQQILIKRLIAAALIFFVFVAVKFLISLVADGNSGDIMECADCFISKKCETKW